MVEGAAGSTAGEDDGRAGLLQRKFDGRAGGDVVLGAGGVWRDIAVTSRRPYIPRQERVPHPTTTKNR
jgi:hypothetical protein